MMSSHFSFILLCCCICLAFIRLSKAQINLGGRNETDRLALLAFKDQITIDPLKVMSSWNDSHHYCEWEGVTCGLRHPRVTMLNLDSQGLVGSISPHIGNLSFLRLLNLQNNSFHGVIPREIGRLFRLEGISLINNSLVGEIPINISLCYSLTRLFLSGNNFVGKIPMELGSLPKLVSLALENDNLTGEIPPSLGNITTLKNLALSYNNLEGVIPSTLYNLKSLEILSIHANTLSGMFPSSLYNLSTLQVISISANQLTGNIPSETNLHNLQFFLIGGNRFSGHIPSSLFNASKLFRFDISGNQFTGKVPVNLGNLNELTFLALQENSLGSGKSGDFDFITPLTNCSNLETIVLYSNELGGSLPVSVANFSKSLTSLYLSQNQITGNIPKELENLQNLILLDLSTNFFNGSIPIGLGNLRKLQILGLQNNQLSGQVPLFLWNMSQLVELDLSNNILEGSIASALDNQNLQILDLSRNNFTGPIPREIGLSSHLIRLVLRHNSLNGSIPLEVGNLKNLGYLDVSENNLTGEIPGVLSSLSLEYIYMGSNFFQGPLPSSLADLEGLLSLDVSHNNLSGIIPRQLGKLSVLTTLNLSFNNFEGAVPVEGVFRNSSAFSVFGNLKICGGPPNLRLPKCRIQRSKKQDNGLAVKVILGVLIPSLIVGFCLIFLYFRKNPKGKPSSEEGFGDLKRVSYNDLYKATDGFSSTNLIGRGSYGSVYKGILQQDESPVAVKVLNLIERGASKTFMAECEALREVRHRNLLKILTVCSSVDFKGEGFKALVFEFMPNGSLESWLHPSSDGQDVPRSLNLCQRLNIGIDVASGLEYLHNHCERPIAHCDLKSSNILLSDDLTAHVGDFGLAKFLSAETRSTITSNKDESSSIAIRGTIGYIPPEYGAGGEVSTQGDIYSFGICLLEMFTRKRPTDQMFKDGHSLHEFSKLALPHRVMEIIDERLLSEETHNGDINALNRMRECLSSIIRIGIACSVDIMTERMDIKDVLKELHSIKAIYLQV
ncbi:hypothetical protein AQUCO_03000016v1 [Aquilegia coerulea]|uniref:non-specific serine/threonine protein kinase n=1 Tax=Aquilegia coerulea TaxID=218851 RepID=A0A2G5D0V8_AQUCA|nr:hypothetical protein AQUCO_03000016v1 [Aquilegia coerulea]